LGVVPRSGRRADDLRAQQTRVTAPILASARLG
jgi:hypothetical protein